MAITFISPPQTCTIFLSIALPTRVWYPIIATFFPNRFCFNIKFISRITALVIRLRNVIILTSMEFKLWREVEKLDDGGMWEEQFEMGVLVREVRDLDLGENGKRYVKDRLESEVRWTSRKNVYVAMKWLIFMHQIIQIANRLEILELMESLLDQMTNPYLTEKFQSYLHSKLFCPYKQYLKKLTCKKINSLDRCEESFAYQAYGEYNFINYAITEFARPIREFTPFLKHQYPCLNHYIDLIGQDLQPQYRRIVHSFEQNLLQKVTFIEIQKIGSKLLLFKTANPPKKTLQATNDNSNSTQPQPHSPHKTTLITITPFQSLQSSNLCLNFFNKE